MADGWEGGNAAQNEGQQKQGGGWRHVTGGVALGDGSGVWGQSYLTAVCMHAGPQTGAQWGGAHDGRHGAHRRQVDRRARALPGSLAPPISLGGRCRRSVLGRGGGVGEVIGVVQQGVSRVLLFRCAHLAAGVGLPPPANWQLQGCSLVEVDGRVRPCHRARRRRGRCCSTCTPGIPDSPLHGGVQVLGLGGGLGAINCCRRGRGSAWGQVGGSGCRRRRRGGAAAPHTPTPRAAQAGSMGAP